MSLPKQRLGDDLSAFGPAYNLIHHNSSRITRFLLHFCVSIFQVEIYLDHPCLVCHNFFPILRQHLRWPIWSSACRVVWEATESSRFLQLIRLQDGIAESLPMHIRLMGSGGMLSITCWYYCLQRPRCPNRTHCISKHIFGGNFLGWHLCKAEVGCSSSRDGQSEEWIRIPANRAAWHESQMDGNSWLAMLGTHCIIV